MKTLEHSQYEEFKHVLDRLLILSRYNRKSMIENGYYKEIPPYQFAKEFKTVKCNVGRRSGKSRYINERATPNDIIICHNEIVKRELYSTSNATVITSSLLKNKIEILWNRDKMKDQWIIDKMGIALFLNKEIIYVDEPSLCARDLKPYTVNEWLYGTFDDKNDMCQTFVLLGD